MEELLQFVPIIIIVLTVIFSGKKKTGTQAKKEKPAPAKKPERSRQKTDAATIGRTIAAERKKKTEQPAATVSAAQGEDPCHEYMLSPREEQMEFHPSSEAEFEGAGEGEDPCHVGNAAEPPAYVETTEEGTAWGSVQRNFSDGIIMTEILKRPSERRRERPRYRYGKAANE